jgi:hypothetical protein
MILAQFVQYLVQFVQYLVKFLQRLVKLLHEACEVGAAPSEVHAVSWWVPSPHGALAA